MVACGLSLARIDSPSGIFNVFVEFPAGVVAAQGFRGAACGFSEAFHCGELGWLFGGDHPCCPVPDPIESASG